ncbi:MAG: fumarylacetoacetate hydrolase family protein [Pseudomonadota bacterium]
MKLASFSINGFASYGVVAGEEVIDLRSRLGETAPTLQRLIANGFAGVPDLAASITPDFALDEVTLLPVIPEPGAVWCCGLNTHSHFEETKHIFGDRGLPQVPMFFLRSKHTLVGSGQAIEKPALETDFDYEGEIAVIIGERCRNVPLERAMEHVAGYACFNDGSARQYQIRSHQVTTGKNAYHSGGFGPWMVTADEVTPADLKLQTRVNGDIRQNMEIDDLVFSIPQLIAHISEITWLEPGDVIVTGSPEGAGALLSPQQFLKEGDVVDVEVSGIGTLTNPVVEQSL